MKLIKNKHIKPDKSIDVYISDDRRLIFIYDNQGLYFDVFFSNKKVKAFLDNKIDRGDIFFDDEQKMNNYFGFS